MCLQTLLFIRFDYIENKKKSILSLKLSSTNFMRVFLHKRGSDSTHSKRDIKLGQITVIGTRTSVEESSKT